MAERMTAAELADVLACSDLQPGESRKVLSPLRDERTPSLNVTRTKGGKWLFHDHGDPDAKLDDFIAAVGGKTNGARARVQARAQPRSGGTVEATYDYVDADGTLVHQTARLRRKRFRQRRPDGNGGWINNVTGITLVLYRLPEVIGAVERGDEIFIVEGEKDADAVVAAGGIATCNPMGAGKWRNEFAEHFRGASVSIVADDDTVGRKHARDVARSLTQVAASVRVVRALTGKDASDHLEAGHGLDEFVESRLPVARSGAIDGASFILDNPADVPALWGRGQEVLHASGESLLLVGPQGVGKSTLVQQYALARIGLRSDLLGFPVEKDERGVLYLAADRPSQIHRSIARMATEDDRDVLLELLTFWQGPLPFNLSSEPERFAPFVEEFDVGTVIIDSLKDVALDLSKDESGSRVNAALQETLARGIEVVATHHQRKAQANNKKPTTLSDVYGSVWVTAGAGSVLLIWGEAGDAAVELTHLKQPAEEVGPMHVVHDHATGTSTVQQAFSIRAALAKAKGMTVKEAASKRPPAPALAL